MSREERSRRDRNSRDDSTSRGRDSGERDSGSSRRETNERSSNSRYNGRDSARRSSFKYQERSNDTYKQRGEAGGGDFDKYLKDNIKMFKPADGDNMIRVMPPTFHNAQHFGLDIHVHYQVGPDSQTYLCLFKMKGEPCPICDERERASRDGDTEYADKLKPTKRVLIYMIDRHVEKDGPVVWSMPWTIDRDVCKLVVDKRTGETLPIDHPERGYDIEFERKGKADRTQYIGLAIARRESPLGDARWLDFIQDNPLDAILVYYPYDHIAKVFGGKSVSRDSNKELDRQDEDLQRVEDKGRRSTRNDDALTWECVHSMSFDELCSLADQEKLKINPDDSADDTELADWICDDLRIEKKALARPRQTEEPSMDDKMDKMRSRRRSVE